jgi:hypothetical protein
MFNDGEKWSRKNSFEIPPCAHHVISITEFVLLIKIPPFYEVNSFNRKCQAHGGISKIVFLDHRHKSVAIYGPLIKMFIELQS